MLPVSKSPLMTTFSVGAGVGVVNTGGVGVAIKIFFRYYKVICQAELKTLKLIYVYLFMYSSSFLDLRKLECTRIALEMKHTKN